MFRYTNFSSLSIRHKQDIILWIRDKNIRKYFRTTKAIQDFAIINALSKYNLNFNIVFGNKIGKFKKKKILFTLSRDYDPFGFDNHVAIIKHICYQLESQGNKLFPSQRDALFWENKAFMHKAFKELDISHPKTYLYQSKQEVYDCPLKYPFLIKEEGSASATGIHKIGNRQDLEQLLTPEYFIRNEYVIVQELIKMKKSGEYKKIRDKWLK